MTSSLSRRSFIAAGAGAAFLAACGSEAKKRAVNLLGFYAPDAVVAGSTQRLPFGLADGQGALLDKVPPKLTFSITGPDGRAAGQPLEVASHNQGLPRAYYPVELPVPAPGVYTLSASVDGQAVSAKVQPQATSPVRQPGQAMVPFDTPTEADRRGVELLCTHTPPCPLHDVTLRQALTTGKPVAFLVATPQFCQTAICGPVLDVVLGVRGAFPTVQFLHSEVYPSVAKAQPSTAETVPVVQAYGLSFEPCLFLARPDGTIAQRLDVIVDTDELKAALTTLTS